MLVNLKKINILSKKINIFFSSKSSIFILKNTIFILFFKMPSFYFKKLSINTISFIFITKFYYNSFISHLMTLYNSLIVSYFIKIKIKGLGYRIRYISNSIFYFFFNYTNYFYLFRPYNLIIKIYKKRMMLFSFS
jgi:hypothetical protein